MAFPERQGTTHAQTGAEHVRKQQRMRLSQSGRPLIHGCALDRVLDKIVAVSYVCDRIVSELKYLAVSLAAGSYLAYKPRVN